MLVIKEPIRFPPEMNLTRRKTPRRISFGVLSLLYLLVHGNGIVLADGFCHLKNLHGYGARP